MKLTNIIISRLAITLLLIIVWVNAFAGPNPFARYRVELTLVSGFVDTVYVHGEGADLSFIESKFKSDSIFTNYIKLRHSYRDTIRFFSDFYLLKSPPELNNQVVIPIESRLNLAVNDIRKIRLLDFEYNIPWGGISTPLDLRIIKILQNEPHRLIAINLDGYPPDPDDYYGYWLFSENKGISQEELKEFRDKETFSWKRAVANCNFDERTTIQDLLFKDLKERLEKLKVILIVHCYYCQR